MAQPSRPTQTGSPPQDVIVTFTAPDTWSFTPESVTLDGPGIVNLKRPSGATWTFVGAQIEDPHGQFHPSVPSPFDKCIVRDDWKVKGAYKYVVTVKDGGMEYTSPDPEIINSGP